ncbi:MAG: hypothetical protein V4702_00130 [Patescibacteria group bacterium]
MAKKGENIVSGDSSEPDDGIETAGDGVGEQGDDLGVTAFTKGGSRWVNVRHVSANTADELGLHAIGDSGIPVEVKPGEEPPDDIISRPC